MNIYIRDGQLYIVHYKDRQLVFTKYKSGETGWTPDGETVPVKSIQVEVDEASYLNGEYIGITDRYF